MVTLFKIHLKKHLLLSSLINKIKNKKNNKNNKNRDRVINSLNLKKKKKKNFVGVKFFDFIYCVFGVFNCES